MYKNVIKKQFVIDKNDPTKSLESNYIELLENLNLKSQI